MEIENNEDSNESLNNEIFIKSGMSEDDIIKKHMIWIGYAMSKVFDNGYDPNKLISLNSVVNSFECIMIDKVDKKIYGNIKEKINKLELGDMFEVVKIADGRNLKSCYELYNRIVEKYKLLITLSKKVHVSTPTTDYAFDEKKKEDILETDGEIEGDSDANNP